MDIDGAGWHRSAVRTLVSRAWVLGAAVLLAGCNGMTVLSPAGVVGVQEKSVIVFASALMLLVVVPVIVLTLVCAWRYRASNQKATYAPDWSHSAAIEVVAVTIPTLIIVVLAGLVWISSHQLDPARPLETNRKPITVEAIALDWKWLFIYPDQNIAVVNELAMPVGVPVSFRITSDTVMNSLYIPQLGGQVYAMAGMQTRLNLEADRAGTYDGMSSQFSGDGFSGMRFHAIGMSQDAFARWLNKVRQSPVALDRADYARLAAPTAPGVAHPPEYFSSVQPELFENIVARFAPMGHPGDLSASDAAICAQGLAGGSSDFRRAREMARR
jgi:cytochrome o ubiquinol oxidase subunit 2